MQKVYTRINWENVPSEATPINETNLNRMDYALNEIDGRVVAFDTSKAEQSDLLQTLKTVSYDSTTGVFTFTLWNGTTITADLNIEKIPVSFAMDANGIITMTTSDGSTYTADVGSLIKTYTFNDSTDIDFNVVTDSSGNKTVTATIVDGSVTASKLQPNYLADIQTEVASAQAYANSASGSATTAGNQALEAEAWADGQKNGVDVPSTAEQYHNNAKYWAEQAQQAGSSGHTIVDENGTSYAQEPNLQFVGVKVSDDSTNNKTVVTVWEHKTKAQWDAMTPQEQADGNFIVSGLGTTGDLKNNYVSFTSGDSADADATSWTSVQPMANTDVFSVLFNKISTMAKNVRYLYKMVTELQTGHLNDASITASSEKIEIIPETGSAYYPCFYIKVGCVVHVYLGLTNLTPNTSSTIITLPVGYRPANSIVNIGRGRDIDHFARISITNGGLMAVISEDSRAFTAFSFVV